MLKSSVVGDLLCSKSSWYNVPRPTKNDLCKWNLVGVSKSQMNSVDAL